MSKKTNKIIHIVFVHMIVWLGVVTFLSVIDENKLNATNHDEGTIKTKAPVNSD